MTPSTAPKNFAALPCVMTCASTSTTVDTMPLKMFTRTGVPSFAFSTPRNRGAAPS